MVHQHHRYNCHALVPVGDFVLRAAEWTGRPPMSLFGVFDGYSPVSNVSSPEIQPAVAALRADAEALELLGSDTDPAALLDMLRARVPAIDEYVANVHFRLIEGFDVDNPTIGERPETVIGRLRAAVQIDRNAVARALRSAARPRPARRGPRGPASDFDESARGGPARVSTPRRTRHLQRHLRDRPRAPRPARTRPSTDCRRPARRADTSPRTRRRRSARNPQRVRRHPPPTSWRSAATPGDASRWRVRPATSARRRRTRRHWRCCHHPWPE